MKTSSDRLPRAAAVGSAKGPSAERPVTTESRRERSFLREDRAARSDPKRQQPAPENALSVVTHFFAQGTFRVSGNHPGPRTSADYSKNSGWNVRVMNPTTSKIGC